MHNPECGKVNKASPEFIIGHLTVNVHSLNEVHRSDQTWAQVIQVFMWMLVGLACEATCCTHA